MKDYGWTPVEVTPSSDGSYSTSYPGLDTGTLEGLISEMGLNINASGTNEVRTEDAGTKQTSEGGSMEAGFSLQQGRGGMDGGDCQPGGVWARRDIGGRRGVRAENLFSGRRLDAQTGGKRKT